MKNENIFKPLAATCGTVEARKLFSKTTSLLRGIIFFQMSKYSSTYLMSNLMSLRKICTTTNHVWKLFYKTPPKQKYFALFTKWI